ncbi:hypothetical protein [Kitasatospora sp. NPDC057015]|uniref:hypothetical protein n=1 Tax=Kitasatospora sp. NPDC057015 TaxID=3346001 RepID=UPI003641FA11
MQLRPLVHAAGLALAGLLIAGCGSDASSADRATGPGDYQDPNRICPDQDITMFDELFGQLNEPAEDHVGYPGEHEGHDYRECSSRFGRSGSGRGSLFTQVWVYKTVEEARAAYQRSREIVSGPPSVGTVRPTEIESVKRIGDAAVRYREYSGEFEVSTCVMTRSSNLVLSACLRDSTGGPGPGARGPRELEMVAEAVAKYATGELKTLARTGKRF